jgi:hypothetical protein
LFCPFLGRRCFIRPVLFEDGKNDVAHFSGKPVVTGRFRTDDNIGFADIQPLEQGKQLLAPLLGIGNRNAVEQRVSVRSNDGHFMISLGNVNSTVKQVFYGALVKNTVSLLYEEVKI